MEKLRNLNKIGYVPQKISIDWTLPLRVNDFMVLTENLKEELINGFIINRRYTSER